MFKNLELENGQEVDSTSSGNDGLVAIGRMGISTEVNEEVFYFQLENWDNYTALVNLPEEFQDLANMGVELVED